MAEGDGVAYNHAKEQFLIGGLDLSVATLKIALFGSGYSLDIDGNNGYANVSAQEITVTGGYTAGGKTLTGNTVTQDDGNDRAKFDAANVTWTSLETATIAHAIIYDDNITTPVAKPLIFHFEIATNSNGNDYTLNFHTNGIALLS